MDLFTQVKMAVSVKEAAEYYGLEVKRGSMVCCPFHNDRTPSMKLNEDYFYCFGCGATGDVIDLVAKLFNLSSYDAAKKLADYIEDLTDILTFAELEIRVKTVDMLQKDGMINRLEERLKRTAKEVDARDETEIG